MAIYWKFLMSIWCVCALLMFSNNSEAGDLWTWKDQKGSVAFGDRPSAGAIDAKIVSSTKNKESKRVPDGMELAVRDNPITLFVTSCGDGCDQATSLLEKYGIPFDSKDPTKKDVFPEFKKHSPSALSPTIVIGSTAIVGFDEQKWTDALGSAGYKLRKKP